MQKEFIPNPRGQAHYQNQQVGNYPPVMQSQISQAVYMQNGQSSIRMAGMPQMAQFNNAQSYVPLQTQYGPRGYMQPQYNTQYQYQPQPYYAPRGGGQYHSVYVVPQGQFPVQQSIGTSQNQHITGQRMYNQIPTTQQPTPQHTYVAPQEQAPQQKKRPAIVLKDPTTGKDVTNLILKKGDKTTPSSGYSSASSTPPLPQDDKKAKIQAEFAEKVAAVASSSSPSQTDVKTVYNGKSSEVTSNTDAVQPLTLSVESKPVKITKPPQTENNLHKSKVSENAIEHKQNEVEFKTKEVKVDEKKSLTENSEKLEGSAKVESSENTESSENIESSKKVENSEDIESSEKVGDSEKVETSEKDVLIQGENTIKASIAEDSKQIIQETVVDETVTSQVEDVLEAQPEKGTQDNTQNDNNTIEQEDSEKPVSAFSTVLVPKKKKPKNRFKDMDAKDSANNNDMLSAFVDNPVEEKIVKQPEAPKVPEKAPEDKTWEEKEKSIEKEVIRNEDAEEPEILPKRTETKIIKSEDTPNTTISDDEKLQYDRDFLLKLQFASISTSKPQGLPDIDIVLNQAHAPVKALVPGQRISAPNDFMPQFMRSTSGGRSSSGGRSKGSGGGRGGGRPQKVIQAPVFQKVELKKSENAWVRPKDQDKELPEEEKITKELERNVRSVLNKLTPQKFKTLVAKMLELNIDNAKKLESAIDLIFEKAVSEPGFSVAYANMCRVLTDNFKFSATNTGEKTQTSTVTFRKVLLNKCQKEFEKESSDEKLLEEDRLKKFETEEEKKAWKETLDYREMMNRRRMLGNIRFIGELFKLKMISENIMHDCILKLLRAEKQDSLEDQLECLCKLLSTIGKDLDHTKAKPRMDQYFVQINRIIEKKKISSRIKFALRDVMDLRVRDWVPRRDEGNPKTIDQIHREAIQKEKKEEMARQQDKLQRKIEPRGGRGGRDSPNVRSGGPSSDGWTNVAGKSNRSTTPIVASKFKLTKKVTDSTEISLGPGGGKPGAWSRGASGGGSRSGSGANTPTSEFEQRPNRYDLLTDQSMMPTPSDGKSRGGRNNVPSRRGTPTSGGGRMASDDGRNSALRAVKDMTSRSSRNSSPARSSPSEDTYSAPSSGTQTPVEKSQSPVALITEEKMRKTTKSTVEEYLNCRDVKEALLCIKELCCPSMHHVLVEESICVVLEKKPEHRRLVGTLLHYFIKEQLLSKEDMCQGFASMVELAQDLACDVPLIYKYLGEVLGPVVYDGTLPLNKVKDTLEPLVQQSKAGLVMAEALSVAVELAGKEDSVGALWCESRVTWDMLLNNDENVETFVKEKKMEFTLKTVSTQSSPSHSSQIQEEMLKIFKEKEDVTNDIMNLITNKVPVEQQSSPDFIRQLTGVVCNSTISTSDNSTTCSCNKELLKKRSNIMRRYINKNRTLELHALYVLQELVTDLNHPRDLLRVLFEELYHAEVISEEAYYDWENSKDFPDGKGVALSTVKSFLEWLKKAEEEQNEEDASTPPTTNVA